MTPKILIVSSSHDPNSRSEFLARRCEAEIGSRAQVEFLKLKDFHVTGDELHDPLRSPNYRTFHSSVKKADGILLASPIYNWSCCAELKRFVELVGTTPRDGTEVESAFFDKIITFVNAGGGNFSYTGFAGLASSMALDFKCIVSPYNIYLESADWNDGRLSPRIDARLKKSMYVFLELVRLLEPRTYTSKWEL